MKIKNKSKNKTKLQKKKQYELNKKRALIRKQTEADKEIKQSERDKKKKMQYNKKISTLVSSLNEIQQKKNICQW